MTDATEKSIKKKDPVSDRSDREIERETKRSRYTIQRDGHDGVNEQPIKNHEMQALASDSKPKWQI